MNFWEKLKEENNGKPILCLAPMADVTDAAFRYIIAKYSKKIQEKIQGLPLYNFVTYTEFVSADGLVLAPEKGLKKLLKDLEYSEIERPIVAQLFGSKPENMEKATRLVAELGFDGVDINMGCPDKSIEKQGAGSALIKNPKLARELIIAAKRGVQKRYKDDPCTKGGCGVIRKEIPVSVKTRLGYNKDELEEWLPELLAENPAVITIHARTRKEMSKVPARWERIKRAVEIRNDFTAATERNSLRSQDASHTSLREFSLSPKTLIIGNGDVLDTDDARKKCEESGADGAMIGRAIFGNPWLFSDYKPTNNERLQVLIEHTKLFEEKFGGINPVVDFGIAQSAKAKPNAKIHYGVKSFAIMKKHFKEYLKDSSLRDLKYKLMRTENAKEVQLLVNDFLILYN